MNVLHQEVYYRLLKAQNPQRLPVSPAWTDQRALRKQCDTSLKKVLYCESFHVAQMNTLQDIKIILQVIFEIWPSELLLISEGCI